MINPVASAASAFLDIIDALPVSITNFMMLGALLFALSVIFHNVSK